MTMADAQRGQHYVDSAKEVAKGVVPLARGASTALDAAFKPLGYVGPHILKGMGRIGRGVANSEGLTKGLFGAAVLAPILMEAANSGYSHETQRLLDSSRNPERTVLASLKNHFIKTAAGGPSAPRAFGQMLPEALAGGIGKSVGSSAVDLLLGGVSHLGKRMLDSTVTNPRRERVFYEAIKTDQILRDALRNNPQMLGQLKEAFSTLTRFAPSLSEDINAVRSYLREAVISGAGINYATVKQLAETEKLISDRMRPGGKK